MSLYIDTSALLKLFFAEPESAQVAAVVSREDPVIVSSLARLEMSIQIQRRVAGGMMSLAMSKKLLTQINARLGAQPFQSRSCSITLIDVAMRQITRPVTYCPTLDRLHLAAMETFGLQRLLTNDHSQAAAARTLGFEVISVR